MSLAIREALRLAVTGFERQQGRSSRPHRQGLFSPTLAWPRLSIQKPEGRAADSTGGNPRSAPRAPTPPRVEARSCRSPRRTACRRRRRAAPLDVQKGHGNMGPVLPRIRFLGSAGCASRQDAASLRSADRRDSCLTDRSQGRSGGLERHLEGLRAVAELAGGPPFGVLVKASRPGPLDHRGETGRPAGSSSGCSTCIMDVGAVEAGRCAAGGEVVHSHAGKDRGPKQINETLLVQMAEPARQHRSYRLPPHPTS